jgi:TIR domain
MTGGVSEEHRFMAAPRNSAHPEVFVSYASHDRERVMTVVRSLQSHEVSLWLDQDRMSGGMSWAQQIVQAIRSCKVLLLMCSNAAMRSRAVAQEIQMAWKYQLSYLPLFLERTSFPEQVEFFLEGCQWIEVLDRPVERWLTDILGALQNAGVFCSKPVHQGSSEKSIIRCPPEKPQESLILGVPFSVVAESRLGVSPRRSPFYCRFQRWSDELSSFYLVFVWWSRRLGGHSHVAVM